jgi:hypothetical protein
MMVTATRLTMPAIAALLLGMMGLAWVETHLLPPLEHHLKPKALPVPARDALPADPPERPGRRTGLTGETPGRPRRDGGHRAHAAA